MAEKRRILIVDDDEDLSMLLCDMLEDNGYEAFYVPSIEAAYDSLTDRGPDLILLDINLPDGTGFSLCQELRKRSQVPIIFASARTSEDDKVNGLDMGGDDYLAKPYSLKELLSRIRSLLRRTYGAEEMQQQILSFPIPDGRIEVDSGARTVKKNGQLLALKPKEYDLLLYLARQRGKALSKETLLNAVWGVYSEAEQASLTVHIRWLREKLEKDPSKPELIKTVWGVGYKMEEV